MMKNRGWLVIVLFVSISIVLWVISKPFDLSFTTAGQLTAIIGVTLFSLNFFLITRNRLLEDLFGGIDKVYVAHHITGGLALIFLLFHPVLLAVDYLKISVGSAAFFLFPGFNNSLITDYPTTFGRLALTILILLLFITFYLKLPYHIWKLSHKFMGVAYILAALHVIFIPSDVSIYMPLRIWLMILLVIGTGSYVYKTILGRFTLKKLKYKLASIKKLTQGVNTQDSGDIWEIVLEPMERSITFVPGQFCFLEFQNKKVGSESHPFSITSSPKDINLKFVIKEIGDYTSKLAKLKVGDTVLVEGAYGGFRFSKAYKNQIWIAGGIGITPFVSMINAINSKQTIDLFYSVKNKNEFIYLQKFENFQKAHNNFKLYKWKSTQKGRITVESIVKLLGNIEESIIYLCGPVVMMNSIKQQFEKLGVPGRNIRMEEFELV